MLIKQTKIRWQLASITLQKPHMPDPKKPEQYFQEGIYKNGYGTVNLYICTQSPQYKDYYITTLTFFHGGSVYDRYYNCTFSERGLMLICARFIKDVVSGKFQPTPKKKK